MSDLIRRADAIKALYKYDFVTKGFIEREIKAIPSVDIPHSDDWEKYSDKLWKNAYERGKADRPQGEWKAKSFHEFFCNNCGFSFDMMKCEFLENMKYCPNCGVRKGADDER